VLASIRRALLLVLLVGCAEPGVTPDAAVPDDVGIDADIDAAVDPCALVTEASVETVASFSSGRYSPAVAPLPDGRVLVAGGYDFTSHMTREAMLFDPLTRALEPAASELSIGRNFAATAIVPSGVLVIGGFDDRTGSITSVERYDLETGAFVPAGALSFGREAHTATLMPDGRVFVAGGLQARGLVFMETMEIYDPASDTFATSVSSLLPRRGFHTAEWIESLGSVLIVGGDSGMGELASAVRWLAATDEIVPIGNDRAHAGKALASVLLPEGRVLVTGGANATDGTLADADLYDPTTDRFTASAPMVVRRMAHTLTALGDGRVVAIGGWSDSEPGPAATASIEVRGLDGTWERLPVDLAVARLDHRTVALDACHVVVIGGQYAHTGEPSRAPVEVELVTIPR
jgi:hypothetical protein